MDSKVTNDASVDHVGQTINKDSIHIATRRAYTSPQIILLANSNIESGTTTNLKEATGGVWKTGS